MTEMTRPERTRSNPTRSRLLRWSVPAALLAAVAVVASGVLAADATPPLPDKTAAQLLVDLQSSHVDSLSGTVVQKSDLGLPALPSVGVRGSAALTSLLAGSNTLRVWYAGEEKQRIALLGTLGETDIIHNGRDAWVWSSEDNTAVHYRLPAPSTRDHDRPPLGVPSPVTPQQAADEALRALDPTTAVTTDGTARVAGRSAYELVLRPRDTRSLVGQVRLAVDADTGVPLRVRVYPRAAGSEPAFEVGFTRISFARPGDEQFQFTPPPNTRVREETLDAAPKAPDAAPKAPNAPNSPKAPKAPSGTTEQLPATVGTGWTTVAVIPGVQLSFPERDGAGWEQFVRRLPRVSGDWGSGRLLTSKLVSALLTDDGRLVVGPVGPELLYNAARRR